MGQFQHIKYYTQNWKNRRENLKNRSDCAARLLLAVVSKRPAKRFSPQKRSCQALKILHEAVLSFVPKLKNPYHYIMNVTAPIQTEESDQSKPAPKLPSEFVQIPRVIFEDLAAGKLNNAAVVTYCLLVGHAIESDSCWPSQDTLAELAGCGIKKIQRGIRKLKDAGYIESRSRGFKRANLITLLKRVPRVKESKTVCDTPTALPAPVTAIRKPMQAIPEPPAPFESSDEEIPF